MTRSEFAVTIGGLIATFCLPWPHSEAAPEPGRAAPAVAAERRAAIESYGSFGRFRTGPPGRIQPTR